MVEIYRLQWAASGAILCAALAGLAFAQPAANPPAQPPPDPAAQPPAGEIPLDEQFDLLRTLIISDEADIAAQARQRVEQLADAHGLEIVGPLLEKWKTDWSPDVRRFGLVMREALMFAKAGEPLFSRASAAHSPCVATFKFVRVMTGAPETGGAIGPDGWPEPAARYGFLADTRVDESTGHTQFSIIGLNWLTYQYRRARDAKPTDMPFATVEDFGAMARQLAREAIANASAVFAEADPPGIDADLARARRDYLTQQMIERAETLTVVAVMAAQCGRKTLAGETIEAADHLATCARHLAMGPTDPGTPERRPPGTLAPTFLPFAEAHIAKLLLRRHLVNFARGETATVTADALDVLGDALDPGSWRFYLGDVRQQFRALAMQPLAPAPSAEAANSTESAALAALAEWHIENLRGLSVRMPAGDVPGDLHVFSSGNLSVFELWRLNVHAIPALIVHLKDRRPTRTLVPLDGGMPYPVRIGDVCFHILRRLSGQQFALDGFSNSPLPTLNHDESGVASKAARWWVRCPTRTESQFLMFRIADRANPDRLAMLDRLHQAAPDDALEYMRAMAATDAELETAVVNRIIAHDLSRARRWLGEFLARAKMPATRAAIARALFENFDDPHGVEFVRRDVMAGHFDANDFATLATRCDLLRAVAAASGDESELAAVDAAISRLALADADLAPLQRLAVLRYLVDPRPMPPASYVAAVVVMLRDRRFLTGDMPPEVLAELPDEISGTRWCDHAAAAGLRLLRDDSGFDFAAPIPIRDAAMAHIAGRLETADAVGNLAEALVVANAWMRVSVVGDVGGEGEVPAVDADASADALRGFLAADPADAEALATARANCLKLGLGFWPHLVRLIRSMRGERRERLVALSRDLAGIVRGVRVTVALPTASTDDSANRSGSEFADAADRFATDLQAALVGQIGESAVISDPGPAAILVAIEAAIRPHTAVLAVARVDAIWRRRPDGQGACMDIIVSVMRPDAQPHARTAQPVWMRSEVAVERDVSMRRAISCRVWPDAELAGMLLMGARSAFGEALRSSTEFTVEWRLAISPAR